MILETFLVNNTYNKYVDKVDEGEYNGAFFNYCIDTYKNYLSSPYIVIGIIMSVITAVVAYMLAWRCNSKEPIIYRIINSILAALFSDIYVIYYLIYRVLLKNKCY